MKKYLLLLVVITGLMFTYCRKNEPVKNDTEKYMSLPEYLSLDIWEKEGEAFAFLEKVSSSDDLDLINGYYKDAAALFGEVLKGIEGLKLQGETEKMNKLQKDVCSIYISGINSYLESKNPVDLKNLKSADEKMREFIEILKSSDKDESE